MRVNELYLLYTAPIVPYLSRHGALMVGLDGIASGLYYPKPNGRLSHSFNGDDAYALVTNNRATKAETLTFAGHTVVFRAGSRLVVVDGHAVPMPDRAVWLPKFGQMVVPVAALISGVRLTSTWNAGRRTLSISGPLLTEGIPSESYEAFKAQVFGHESDALIPTVVHLNPLAIGNQSQRNIGTLAVTVESAARKTNPSSPFPQAWFMAQILYPETGRTGLLTILGPGTTRSQPVTLETSVVGGSPVLPVCRRLVRGKVLDIQHQKWWKKAQEAA